MFLFLFYTRNDEYTLDLREEWRMWLKANVNFLRKISCETYLRSSPMQFSTRKKKTHVYASTPFFQIHTIQTKRKTHRSIVKPSSRDKTDTENLTAARARARAPRISRHAHGWESHASAHRRLYCSSIFYRAIYLYRPLLNDENFIANCRGRKGFYGCLCRVFISIPGHSLRASPASQRQITSHRLSKISVPSLVRGRWMKEF